MAVQTVLTPFFVSPHRSRPSRIRVKTSHSPHPNGPSRPVFRAGFNFVLSALPPRHLVALRACRYLHNPRPHQHLGRFSWSQGNEPGTPLLPASRRRSAARARANRSPGWVRFLPNPPNPGLRSSVAAPSACRGMRRSRSSRRESFRGFFCFHRPLNRPSESHHCRAGTIARGK